MRMGSDSCYRAVLGNCPLTVDFHVFYACGNHHEIAVNEKHAGHFRRGLIALAQPKPHAGGILWLLSISVVVHLHHDIGSSRNDVVGIGRWNISFCPRDIPTQEAEASQNKWKMNLAFIRLKMYYNQLFARVNINQKHKNNNFKLSIKVHYWPNHLLIFEFIFIQQVILT